MKHLLHKSTAVLMLCLLGACSSGPKVDESITNEAAQKTIETLTEQQSEQLDALKDSLPEEMVEKIEEHNEVRNEVVQEQRAASDHKAKTNKEIEAMLEDWMTAYEKSASQADHDRLKQGLGKDVVLRDWIRENPEKYEALLQRFKAVKARGE